MLVIGFDYGARRIGAAIGDTLTGSARALNTYANGSAPDWGAIERTVREWRPMALIVGLPLTEDGAEQKASIGARQFAAQLGERLELPVHLTDERYSSREALGRIQNARASGQLGRRARKGDRDTQAAVVIVEQWLNSQ